MKNNQAPIECQLITALRLAIDLSQREFSLRTGVDISKNESEWRLPTVTKIKAICKGLNISYGTFFLLIESIERGKISVARAAVLLKEWEKNKSYFEYSIEKWMAV